MGKPRFYLESGEWHDRGRVWRIRDDRYVWEENEVAIVQTNREDARIMARALNAAYEKREAGK